MHFNANKGRDNSLFFGGIASEKEFRSVLVSSAVRLSQLQAVREGHFRPIRYLSIYLSAAVESSSYKFDFSRRTLFF